ncbi:hypothetical protein BT69DRAFT_1280658 [Atractiella rhizophila]|nr:hypothetical protein BT69DRAFT_1280658 [Atractiella rhizophila]
MEVDPPAPVATANANVEENKATKIYPYGTTIAQPTEIEYVWTIPDVSKLLENPTKIKSPPFGGGRWLVRLNTNASQEIDVFLNALPTPSEVDPQTKKWTRSISGYSFSLRYPISRDELKTHDGHPKDFTQANSSYGRRSFVRSPAIEPWTTHADVRATDSLIMIVKIVEGGSWMDHPPKRIEDLEGRLQAEQRRNVTLALGVFDNHELADVAFVFNLPAGTTLKGNGVEEEVKEMKVYSQKRTLAAFSEYFGLMFDSGMREGLEPTVKGGDSDEDLDDNSAASSYSSSEPLAYQGKAMGEGSAYFSPAPGEKTLRRNSSRMDFQSDGSTFEDEDEGEVEDEDDSDVEVDREYLKSYNPPPTGGGGNRIKQIPITHTRYSTYRSLIFYLLTGSILYAPLRSHARALAMETGSTPRKRTFTHGLNGNGVLVPRQRGWPLPVSPKSVFRIADMYGVVKLRDEARDTILRRLSPSNVAFEVFSTFSSRHEEVRHLQINYLVENWIEVEKSAAWRSVGDVMGGLGRRETASTWGEICTRMMSRNVARPLDISGSIEGMAQRNSMIIS